MPAELTRLPVSLTAEWHDVEGGAWRLLVRIRAESPVRIAILFALSGTTWWWAHHRPPASEHLVPFQFLHADAPPEVVHVTLARNAGRERELLGEDPREGVALAMPARASTGEPIAICSVPALGYEYAIVAVAERDSLGAPDDGWHLRPGLEDAIPARALIDVPG